MTDSIHAMLDHAMIVVTHGLLHQSLCAHRAMTTSTVPSLQAVSLFVEAVARP